MHTIDQRYHVATNARTARRTPALVTTTTSLGNIAVVGSDGLQALASKEAYKASAQIELQRLPIGKMAE
jgi:hypothetical protein